MNTPFALNQFTTPVVAPALVGPVTVGDTTSVQAKFIARFGQIWQRIPGSKSVFYLADKQGKICFTYMSTANEIAAYPDFTFAEFRKGWESKDGSLAANAFYYKLKNSRALHIEHIIKIMKQFDIAL